MPRPHSHPYQIECWQVSDVMLSNTKFVWVWKKLVYELYTTYVNRKYSQLFMDFTIMMIPHLQILTDGTTVNRHQLCDAVRVCT